MSSSESFLTIPLASPPTAYLYDQYSDDEDLQGFFAVLNAFAQGYLNWYTDTPIAVYTNAYVVGLLLDWVGTNMYGVPRPALNTFTKRTKAAMGTRAMATRAMATIQVISSGTTQVANDDVYKRALTWNTWQADGDQTDMTWLKLRIARFLYGVDGANFDVGLLDTISIVPTMYRPRAGMGVRPMATRAMASLQMVAIKTVFLTITLPTSVVAETFKAFAEQAILAFPIQITFVVRLS